jgi:fructose-1,6-bisphosphatase II
MITVSPTRRTGIDVLQPFAMAATRAAAIACQPWRGRGDGHAADGAATDAMRVVLAGAPGKGRVLIGEGEKDGAPMLCAGERLGTGCGPRYDIAVDPLEGTSLLAHARPGALATIGIVAGDHMWDPGPSHYVDKLVVGPRGKGAVDIADSPERNLARLAEALDKPVRDVRVVVLGKPRHLALIARLRLAGAQVWIPPAGDVAGALHALLPDSEVDMLMGIGGTPEGMMTAAAVRALGGGMQIRIAPQRETEVEALWAAGIEPGRTLDLEELVWGDSFFIATGVTSGPLLRGPWVQENTSYTESLVVGAGGARRVVTAGDPLAGTASVSYVTPIAA